MSDLRAELTAIREEHGALTPPILVEEAAPKSHPLHSRFEWDNSVAGHAHRLWQARQLIASVRITYTSAAGETKSVRAFHAIRAADETEYDYESVESIMADSFKRRIVMQDMQRQVAELVARYESFNEFWDVLRKTLRRKKAS